MERYAARTDEFKSGVISEALYRASLFGLGYRGEDIEMEVRANRPAPAVPEYVHVIARAVAVKVMQDSGKRMDLAEWERFVATLWKDNQCAR